MSSRSTIRRRLTAFYGMLFLLCGLVLLTTSYVAVRASLLKDEGRTDRRVIESYGFSEGQVKFFYELPVPDSPTGRQADTVGDVILGIQGDMRDDTLHSLVIGSSTALVALVGLSLLVGWLAAGRALSPVGKLTAKAQRMTEDNLQERLGLDGPNDELKDLADTIDGMLDRLERAFIAQRQFSASVSHELRTPLSVIKAEAEVALADPESVERERALARKMRDAADRSEALLDSMLALARSESTMANREVLDLADLAGDVVNDRVPAADRAGIAVELDLGSARISGDRWLLERLVANLVDNAVTHNLRNGWVNVEVRAEGREAVLRVSNGGERLTPEQVETILQPFQRTDRSRPGYGLGMTIVQSVVRAHEGTIDVHPGANGGLEVTVRLPLVGRSVGAPAAAPATTAPESDPALVSS